MNRAANIKTESLVSGLKISFRDRLKAWWDGYDLPMTAGLPAAGRASHDVRYQAEKQRWETTRLRLVQDLWGEGFSTPGGTEYILNMVKFFALDPAMSVLDLGAGLGGATRTMCEQFGVWVSGFEADTDLAEAGMALSHKAGMGKRGAILPFDPETFEQKVKSVDCVFSKEFFYTVTDKLGFLRAIEMALKSRGQLLFTDYMLSKPHHRSPILDTWIASEPRGAHPWSMEDYRQALAELHLDIRVVQDITDTYQKLVVGSWDVYVRKAKANRLSADMHPALLDEVEIWARRMHAIEAGDLKVIRVHVLKRDTDRLMANW